MVRRAEENWASAAFAGLRGHGSLRNQRCVVEVPFCSGRETTTAELKLCFERHAQGVDGRQVLICGTGEGME